MRIAAIFNVIIGILFLQFLLIPIVYGGEIKGLIKKYNSANITDRRVIIRSLKYEKDESLFQFFAEAADDNDPIIRKHAFEGIGNFKGEPALQILKKSLKDQSPDVVINSIPLFKRFSSNESLPLLLQLLKNKNSSILSTAIDALGDAGNKDTCFYIVSFLNKPDEHVRKSAYLNTGKLLQKFGDMFVKGIDADYDKKIKHEAVKETYRLIGIFVPSFKKTWTDSKTIQKVSLWCLGIFADIFIDRLSTYLMFEEDEALLNIAQKAYEELISIAPILTASFNNAEYENLIWHILSLLKKFKTRDAMPIFIRGLDDASFLIRAASIEGLIALENNDLIEKVKSLLNDPADMVKIRVIEYIEKMGTTEDAESLIPLLDNKNEQVKWRAVKALGMIGNDKSINVLISLLDSDSALIRSVSAQSLGNLGSIEAVNPLVRTMDDESYLVREQIAFAMGRFDNKDAFNAVVKLFMDDNVYVRRSAFNSLFSVLKNSKEAENRHRVLSLIKAAVSDKDSNIKKKALAFMQGK